MTSTAAHCRWQISFSCSVLLGTDYFVSLGHGVLGSVSVENPHLAPVAGTRSSAVFRPASSSEGIKRVSASASGVCQLCTAKPCGMIGTLNGRGWRSGNRVRLTKFMAGEGLGNRYNGDQFRDEQRCNRIT